MNSHIPPGSYRTLSAIGTFVLLLLAQATAAVSADGGVISIDSTTLDGAQKTLPINLSGFSNLGAMTITVEWDASLVRLSLSDGTLPGGAILGNPETSNPVAISFFSAQGFTGNAVIAYLTLAPLKEGAGDIDVSISICVDTDAEPISATAHGGALTVRQPGSAPAAEGSDGDEDLPDADAESEVDTAEGQEGSGSNPESVSIDVSELTIDPAQVLPNQEVTISANICNSGEERGTKTVSLMVNGAAEQSQSVAVSGGACQQVTFKVSRAIPGTYQAAVDGMTGQFSVMSTGDSSATVSVPRQTPADATGIIVVSGIMVVLIAGIIMVFRRR